MNAWRSGHGSHSRRARRGEDREVARRSSPILNRRWHAGPEAGSGWASERSARSRVAGWNECSRWPLGCSSHRAMRGASACRLWRCRESSQGSSCPSCHREHRESRGHRDDCDFATFAASRASGRSRVGEAFAKGACRKRLRSPDRVRFRAWGLPLGLTVLGSTNYHAAALAGGRPPVMGRLFPNITPPSVGRIGSCRKGTAHLPPP